MSRDKAESSTGSTQPRLPSFSIKHPQSFHQTKSSAISTMRNKNAPRGRVFNFIPRSEWNDELAPFLTHLSQVYTSHMVVVLGKAPAQPPGWVRIVTVTSTLPPESDFQHYLPIYPTRKFRKGGVQLKLEGSWGLETVLRLFSYVRIDGVEEVPLGCLREVVRSDGLKVMLQEKSFDNLRDIVQQLETSQ